MGAYAQLNVIDWEGARIGLYQIDYSVFPGWIQ
jgi:hypothetical protein